jgi:putative transposase
MGTELRNYRASGAKGWRLALGRAQSCDRQPAATARGAQYAEDYRAELAMHGLEGSMGRRDNPYDNAKAESFMKTLKWRGCI